MPARTLLVSHDPARREALAAMLREAGRDPLVLDDPVSAAEALMAADPDTLLLDLAHPALSRQALQRGLSPARPAEPESLEEMERRHIAAVLEHADGNRRHAAQLLGISRSTLHNKIRRYDLGRR